MRIALLPETTTVGELAGSMPVSTTLVVIGLTSAERSVPLGNWALYSTPPLNSMP